MPICSSFLGRPSQVVNGVFSFVRVVYARSNVFYNRSSQQDWSAASVCVPYICWREGEQPRSYTHSSVCCVYMPRPNSGDTPSAIRSSIPGIIAHQVPHTRTCEIRRRKKKKKEWNIHKPVSLSLSLFLSFCLVHRHIPQLRSDTHPLLPRVDPAALLLCKTTSGSF